MRDRVGSEWRRTVSRVALIGLVGGASGACSSDIARFSDPFTNPFATAQAEAPAQPEPIRTGSIGAPTAPVETRPLSAPRVATVPAAPRGPALSSRQEVVSVGPGGWTAQGGSTVTVGTGDSLANISDRYGVPTSAILSANGLTAAQVSPGRRIVIPVYNAAGAPQRTRVASIEPIVPAKPAAIKLVESAKPAPPTPADARTRIRPGQAKAEAAKPAVAKPEPVKPQVKLLAKAAEPAKPVKVDVAKVVKTEPLKIAKADAKVAKAEPAKVAKVEPVKVVKVEAAAPKVEPVKVAKVEAAAPRIEPKVAKPEPVKAEIKPAKPEPQKVARVDAPVAPVAAAKAAPEATKPVPPAPKEPEQTASAPAATPAAEFRWPARGRVITGFGGGGGNEGINIAVPEGTPVKAAESGMVAYAGSEVKGYGNLVLIRHDNGYVSAYAHNGEVKVKRGEKVGRGQVIAKSGQTGNVTSPQLHFEIRKGSTPVDPVTHLASQ